MQPIVDQPAWQQARADLLMREKALTAEADRIAALRRRMPWQRVETAYTFKGERGVMSLDDLFEGRSQLLVYHHMLRPADPNPCPGCALVGDQIPHLAHLHARDTSLVFVSRAPLAEIRNFRQRMGWQMPWVETTGSFNMDFAHSPRGPAMSVFLREGGSIYHTYSTTGRGLEGLSLWGLLDMTPRGRQERWEVSPEGVPQTDPYVWWRLHDSYESEAKAHSG